MDHGNEAAEGRARLLEQTEARLGSRFPAAYREAVLAGKSWSRVEEWELLALGDTHLCKHSSWQALQRRKGVVIGHDVGGNALVFLFVPDSSTELAEPVYAWDHESRELERIGASFADVLFPHRPRRQRARCSRAARARETAPTPRSGPTPSAVARARPAGAG